MPRSPRLMEAKRLLITFLVEAAEKEGMGVDEFYGYVSRIKSARADAFMRILAELAGRYETISRHLADIIHEYYKPTAEIIAERLARAVEEARRGDRDCCEALEELLETLKTYAPWLASKTSGEA